MIFNWILAIGAIIFAIGLGYITGWLNGHNKGYTRRKNKERRDLIKKMEEWRKEKYNNK